MITQGSGELVGIPSYLSVPSITRCQPGHPQMQYQVLFQYIHIFVLEVWGPSGPQLLVGGHSGPDFVLRAE